MTAAPTAPATPRTRGLRATDPGRQEAPKRRELGLAAVALTALAAAVYGAQVARGGFYWDDWGNAASTHFAEPGLFGAVDAFVSRDLFGYRPVLSVLIPLPHLAFGMHKWLHIALAAGFGALTAWALYLLLRELGLRRGEAGPPAALLLVFPWCDSTRMWTTASWDTLAVAFWLLGLLAAVRALRAQSLPRRVVLTACSMALYLAATWTYEVLAAVALSSVLVYLLVAPRRAALMRFALDLAFVGGALLVTASNTTRTVQPAHAQLDHARELAGQWFGLLARALVPAADPPGVVGAILLVLVAGAAALALRRLPPSDPRRATLRRWLVVGGVGLAVAWAGYALFVPAQRWYLPLSPGTMNRMNVAAAVGFAVLVTALVATAATLVVRSRAGARALAAVALVAIGAGYVVRVADDQGGWHHSTVVQQRVLDAVQDTVRHPAPGTRIYTFQAPSFVAPGIPAFSLSFDLNSAVRLAYDDPTLAAYPVRGYDVIQCEADRLYPTGGTYGPAHRGYYEHAVFVDVRRHRAIWIHDRAECQRWRARLQAAPG